MTKTDKELEQLSKLFIKAREQLIDTVINYRGVGTKVYANTILKQLEQQIEILNSQTSEFAIKAVSREYQQALDETYAYFKRNKLMMKPPAAFAMLHTDTIYGLAREMQYLISDGLATAGRQVLRYVDSARDEALRAAGLEAAGEKLATGGTVAQMQKNMIQKLQEQGFMTVQYGTGRNARQVPIDAYASLVARSTTREAGNIARETQLKENGLDLMQMSVHFPTCEICAPLQGRVYSISGKDKRFPPLSRAFNTQYRNVHPNCRHVMMPWVEEMRDKEEVDEALETSNEPFEDVRPENEKALYNKQQAQNRQMRSDRYQFERYKARLGDDAPKSFHGFRKVKKANGESWKFTQLDYKRRNQLLGHPELALPNAKTPTAADNKFTKYLFDSSSKTGYAKGLAFTSRLGYNKENWQLLQDEIVKRAPLYPSKLKLETEHGSKYEQKIVIYGLNKKPANVVVGWYSKDGATWMTSCYIKEVD